MLNELFQETIYQTKFFFDRTIGVLDKSSVVVSCNDLDQIGNKYKNINKNLKKSDSAFTLDEYTYKYFEYNSLAEYAVFVSGTDQEAEKICDLLSISLSILNKYYNEKNDRQKFIKNVLLDNILPGDVEFKAQKLNFDESTNKVCILIRTKEPYDILALNVLESLFPDKNNDFIIRISETDISLIKQVKNSISSENLEKLAYSIIEAISEGRYRFCVVGIGTKVKKIKDLARSFKEAQTAIEVGKVFNVEESVIKYEHLGVARLIYQLPTTLCEAFLKETLKDGSIDELDDEITFTVNKFLENNLNVSETARSLFIHRNTLNYRLNKVKKLTGLDIKEFEEAVIFKIASMVKKYLSSDLAKY